MIAVDTNVLLRYMLQDNQEQARKAEKIITGTEMVLVTDVVLVELVWTLRGKKYQLSRQDLIKSILSLFHEPNICFEDGQVVWKALYDYRHAKPVKGKTADFPDALVINKAQSIAANSKVKFDGCYTFDKGAQALPNAKTPT